MNEERKWKGEMSQKERQEIYPRREIQESGLEKAHPHRAARNDEKERPRLSARCDT